MIQQKNSCQSFSAKTNFRNVLLLVFFFIFTREALAHRGLPQTIFCIAYLRICRGNLPLEFAVAICRRFFVFISKFFFVYVSKSCLYGGKPFLYVCKTFWFVRFSLLTVFLLVIVVAVMGHRRNETPSGCYFIDVVIKSSKRQHMCMLLFHQNKDSISKKSKQKWILFHLVRNKN